MGTHDTDPTTGRQQSGDIRRPDGALDRQTPGTTDPAKGSRAKGAHRFGEDGAKAEA